MRIFIILYKDSDNYDEAVDYIRELSHRFQFLGEKELVDRFSIIGPCMCCDTKADNGHEDHSSFGYFPNQSPKITVFGFETSSIRFNRLEHYVNRLREIAGDGKVSVRLASYRGKKDDLDSEFILATMIR